MSTDRSRIRRVVVVLASVAALAFGLVAARDMKERTDSGPRAGSGPLPSSITGTERRAPAVSLPAGIRALPQADQAAMLADSGRHLRLPAVKPGVPVALDISIPSPAHSDGVHAQVTSHPLNPDGTLYVPADPQTVSWANEDAAPGSDRGTVILTSHINFVINGHLVIGALSDLAWYAQNAIGKRLSLRLADGRVLRYRIVAGREYTKDQLASDATLRHSLYDQSTAYGPPGRPTSRLLLVSCGGAFDAYTGEYQDNVFLYALPVD